MISCLLQTTTKTIKVALLYLLTALTASIQAADTNGESTTTGDELKNLDTAGFKALLEQEPELRAIDVRTADEIASLGGTIAVSYTHLTLPTTPYV